MMKRGGSINGQQQQHLKRFSGPLELWVIITNWNARYVCLAPLPHSHSPHPRDTLNVSTLCTPKPKACTIGPPSSYKNMERNPRVTDSFRTHQPNILCYTLTGLLGPSFCSPALLILITFTEECGEFSEERGRTLPAQSAVPPLFDLHGISRTHRIYMAFPPSPSLCF